MSRGKLTVLATIALSTSTVLAQSEVIGNPDFIHLVKENGIWWFADHTGKQFITTGMNHVDEGKILFNEVNEGWLQKEFGEDIKAPWGLNAKAENIGAFTDMVVKDFKDYGFNTIPFHAYTVPLELYDERQIYYVAKIKSQQICLMHMKRDKGERFPDVFSSEFENKLDTLVKSFVKSGVAAFPASHSSRT